MARPGEEGPAFAADFFAAIIAAEMGAGGGSEGVNGEGTTLHFQVRMKTNCVHLYWNEEALGRVFLFYYCGAV